MPLRLAVVGRTSAIADNIDWSGFVFPAARIIDGRDAANSAFRGLEIAPNAFPRSTPGNRRRHREFAEIPCLAG